MEVILLTAVGIGGLILLEKHQKNQRSGEKFAKEHYVDIGAPINYNQQPSTNTPLGTITTGGVQNDPIPSDLTNNIIPCPYENGLLDMSKRDFTDFENNYFIPNKLKDTQNMIGTGIESCQFENFDKNVRFGNDFETPYMSKLDRMNYTNDRTFRHKRESGPLFTPEEQQDKWINGTPLIRPDLDRFTQDIRYKNDEAPFEPIRVGPGIGVDVNMAAQGGFNAGMENRILPTNIFNYNTNSLPGRTIIGKRITAEMPSSMPGIGNSEENDKTYGVPQYKQDTFWDASKRPTLPTGGNHLLTQMEYDQQSTLLKTSKDKIVNYGFGKIKT